MEKGTLELPRECFVVGAGSINLIEIIDGQKRKVKIDYSPDSMDIQADTNFCLMDFLREHLKIFLRVEAIAVNSLRMDAENPYFIKVDVDYSPLVGKTMGTFSLGKNQKRTLLFERDSRYKEGGRQEHLLWF